MTTRDITRTLKRLYGVDVSADLISRVTAGVLDELKEWQHRPLDAVYPIMYIDALVVKVRTNGTVINRPAYLLSGLTSTAANMFSACGSATAAKAPSTGSTS